MELGGRQRQHARSQLSAGVSETPSRAVLRLTTHPCLPAGLDLSTRVGGSGGPHGARLTVRQAWPRSSLGSLIVAVCFFWKVFKAGVGLGDILVSRWRPGAC